MNVGNEELYVATDIEADGPVPGLHSMLSLASAAFRADGTLLTTFSANLLALPEAQPHPDNMRWWSTQPEAWALCRSNARDPAAVMTEYRRWLGTLGNNPVFVGYPAGFDFTFVSYYLFRFVGDNPFFPAALDIRSYAMALLGVPFGKTTKADMPGAWLEGTRPHSHVALDDAIGHGEVFCRMLAERSARSPREAPGRG